MDDDKFRGARGWIDIVEVEQVGCKKDGSHVGWTGNVFWGHKTKSSLAQGECCLLACCISEGASQNVPKCGDEVLVEGVEGERGCGGCA